MSTSAAVAAMLAGRLVRVVELVRFDFVSEVVNVWNGFGPLRTLDGTVWSGLGEIGSISGISGAINGTAPLVTLTVSGVDARFAARAKAEAAEYYLRPLLIFLQFFDDAWAPLDPPRAVSFSRMTRMKPHIAQGEDGDGPVYSCSIEGESFFVNRRRPRYGYWVDTDQLKRSPGDRFCERTQGLEQKLVNFPVV